MTSSTAEDPAPVSPGVQDIALGAPDAPANGVDVVDPSASPAPESSAEQPTAEGESADPSGTEQPGPTEQAQPSDSAAPTQPGTTESPASPTDEADPSAQAAPADDLPQATKEETNEPMPVPEGSQTLVLDKKDTAGFSSVGISWVGNAPLNGIAMQVRTRDAETGEWTAWTELGVNRDEVANPDATNLREGSDPFWFGTSDGVEVAVTVMPGTTISDLKLTLIDPKQVAADSNPSAASSSSAGAATPMPSVYSRAQWGADESKMGWNPRYTSTITAATVHHSADSNNYSAADVPGIMRSIYQYQAVTLGWGDIGYNVVVDKFGRAWEGRTGGLDQPVIAAHAGGFNQYTFGVSIIGNYDLVQVPAAAQEKVAQLIAWKFKLFGVNPQATTQLTQTGGAGTTAKFQDGQTVTLNTIFGHRDTGYTACPGQYGYAMLPSLRNRVATIMASLPAPDTYDPEGGVYIDVAPNGTATISGWAIDRNAIMAPVASAVVVDGQAYYLNAGQPYPPLAYYGIPGDHGFSFQVNFKPGKHDVCMIGTNVGPGTTKVVSCASVNFDPAPQPPVGAMEVKNNGDGSVNFNGWAYDGSGPTAPVTVIFTVDGGNHIFTSAGGPRPELAYYGIPGNHGFNFNYGMPSDGSHEICMYAVDMGPGSWTQVACKKITVTGNNPQGAMSVSKSGGTISVSGYAFDFNDLYAGTTVMLTRNGSLITYAAANQPYPALGYYGIPGNHGFSSSFPAAGGNNSVCMYVGNIGAGVTTLVQCTNV